MTDDYVRKYHAATAASFNFQWKKEDSETKVGNDMNPEGGIGGDSLGGKLTLGLVNRQHALLPPPTGVNVGHVP